MPGTFHILIADHFTLPVTPLATIFFLSFLVPPFLSKEDIELQLNWGNAGLLAANSRSRSADGSHSPMAG